MKRFTKKQYIVAGFLTLVALFPLGTDMAINMIGSTVELPTPAEWRMQRRQLDRLRDECKNQATGSGSAACQPQLVRERLKGTTPVTIEQSTEPDGSVSMRDLDRFERGLVRRAQHAGYCAERLKTIVPGLYELCIRTLRQTGTAR